MLLNALAETSSKTASNTTKTKTQPVLLSTHSSAMSVTSCTLQQSVIADAMLMEPSPFPSSEDNSELELLVELEVLDQVLKDHSTVTCAELKPPDYSHSKLPHSPHCLPATSPNGSSRDTSTKALRCTPSPNQFHRQHLT